MLSSVQSFVQRAIFSLLLTLVQISFSPHPFASIKIKYDSHNFHRENTEHLLIKTMPAVPAKFLLDWWESITYYTHVDISSDMIS